MQASGSLVVTYEAFVICLQPGDGQAEGKRDERGCGHINQVPAINRGLEHKLPVNPHTNPVRSLLLLPQLLILLFFLFLFFFLLTNTECKDGVTRLREIRVAAKRSPVSQAGSCKHTSAHSASTDEVSDSCFLAPQLSGSSEALSFCHWQLQVCMGISLWALFPQATEAAAAPSLLP